MARELHRELPAAGWRVATVADPSRLAVGPVGIVEQMCGHFSTQIAPLRHHADVVHSVYYDPPLWGNSPIIVTVHDMIHELFGAGSRRLGIAKRLAIKRAAIVACGSDRTREDLLARGLDPNKAVTVPLGVSPEILEGKGVADPFDGQPYLLFVGDRDGYKNFGLLTTALESEPTLDRYGLALVGGAAVPEEELVAIRTARRGAPVRQMRVDDRALGNLYRGAAALVVTSRYEGFGLSVVEALACGCPVASSGAGSLSEFDADMSSRFDPDSPSQCAAAILDAADADPDRRARGSDSARAYTWALTAQRYAAVYERVRQP